MRYATLAERKEYYLKELDIQKIQRWFDACPQDVGIKFAVIIGRHTRIFPRKYAKDASTTIIVDEYDTLDDVKSYFLEFLPEAAYYDRNTYSVKSKIVGQELAFDLDPENLTCPIHGTLADKMKRGQGLSFCEIELAMVKEETLKLYEELQDEFSNMRIVFSGRGFHIHVFDRETFKWQRRKRQALSKRLVKKGFLIDEWVTSGSMRLIRLPYSLHGMVSRVVLPVDPVRLRVFDPLTDPECIPIFARKPVATSS